MDLSEPGVGDFVLLETVSEEAFMENLKLRFEKDRIYTFIGAVVVSVNPYRSLNIYTKELIDKYRATNMYELPPHIFSVADEAYRNMRDRNANQVILITGESGAGKTEASKIIMRYIAAVSGSSEKVDRVKDQLLNSNPVLEAFGNAKTQRNDNSSRFGKYMDLQFDYKGDPVGGIVTNYLLEKSRVVYQMKDERTFHVFYQAVRGDYSMKGNLKLSSNPADYAYLNRSGCDTVKSIDDKADCAVVQAAMKTIGFQPDLIEGVFRTVAGILHLGNITFKGDDQSSSVVNKEALQNCCDCFQTDPAALTKALTSRTVKDSAKAGADVATPLDLEQANYSRDALAKATYSRLFSFIVRKINENIYNVDSGNRAVIGVLDIYGFEILAQNSFEQFCINYCNEKLQQVFIELTLKLEQEEYLKEGIQWTPIDYFNNAIICDLIEEKTSGMIAKLDEECMRPGDATAETLIAKLNTSFGKHPHYESRETNRTDKSLGNVDFKLKHYAGDVMYSVEQFLDKNKDLLFRDLMYAMNGSTNQWVKELYPESKKDGDLKRPDSAGYQFRDSMNNLMKNLLAKNPHYVRCIKPNDKKAAGQFDMDLCSHQVRYLGLMENVRVKRAGFCFRMVFDRFLERYKLLTKDTWPFFKGDAKEGSLVLLDRCQIVQEEFQAGKTKMFIRNPLTLFQLESERNKKKHDLMTSIKSRYMARFYAREYQTQRKSVTKISAAFRGHVEHKKYNDWRDSAILVSTLIRGYQARKHYVVLRRKLPKYAAPVIQKTYRQYQNRAFVLAIKAAAAKAGPTWRQVSWPQRPKTVSQKASDELLRIYRNHMARLYRKNLKPDRHDMLTKKGLAEDFFKNKKTTYVSSVGKPFRGDACSAHSSPAWTKSASPEEKIICAFDAWKINRSDAKPVPRTFVLTNQNIHLMEKAKPHSKFPLSAISGVSVSKQKDDTIVFHLRVEKKGDKGDVSVVLPELASIEVATLLYVTSNKAAKVTVSDKIEIQDPKGNSTLAISVDETQPPKAGAHINIEFKKEGKTGIQGVIYAGTAAAPAQ